MSTNFPIYVLIGVLKNADLRKSLLSDYKCLDNLIKVVQKHLHYKFRLEHNTSYLNVLWRLQQANDIKNIIIMSP